MSERTKGDCTQCGEPRSIVSARDVCRDCAKWDSQMAAAEWDLFCSAQRLLSQLHQDLRPQTIFVDLRRAVERREELQR